MNSNRYLRLGGNVSTGGSDTHFHPLDSDKCKALINISDSAENAGIYLARTSTSFSWAVQRRAYTYGAAGPTGEIVTTGTAVVGSTEYTRAENLPSYQNVYAWRRTA